MEANGNGLTFWSLFAGIEGFGAGLEHAGMKCTLQVENNRDCNRVLKRHWPSVRRIDDVNRLRAMLEPRNAKHFSGKFIRPFAICGGFPCQDLSVAGKRAGLAGSRSGLWFTFRRIIALIKPELVLIENVPGLLSSNGGRDFGIILGALGKCGYGTAYRILDAQHFGVPQRRRRVFIVGCLGDWKRAARILFESDCLPWDIEKSGETREGVADCFTAGAHPGGHNGQDDGKKGRLVVASTLNCMSGVQDDDRMNYVVQEKSFTVTARDAKGANPGNLIVGTLNSGGNAGGFRTEPGEHLVFQCHGSNVGPMGTLRSGHSDIQSGVPFTFQTRFARNGRGAPDSITGALTSCAPGTHADSKPHVSTQSGVRRPTPLECERLQGFDDGWTEFDSEGKPISDSGRYRMLGNAVNLAVSKWIGKRIVHILHSEIVDQAAKALPSEPS